MKYILMAFQPKWLALIMNGKKKVEVRTRIPECLKNGEPITVWLYCTKGKPYLYNLLCRPTLFNKKIITNLDGFPSALNGLVVAKCVVEKYDYIENEPSYEEDYLKHNLDKLACMTSDEYYEYATWAKDGHVYALHLTALTVFDKPMELREFYTVCKYYKDGDCTGLMKNRCPHQRPDYNEDGRINDVECSGRFPLTRSPMSWQYVEVGE